eukprot:1900900-Pyramimonas_sp.AAC.1
MICAQEKGRASDFGLLSGCRCSFAISVACNLKVTFRWIPSELNPADGPSRRFQSGPEPSWPKHGDQFRRHSGSGHAGGPNAPGCSAVRPAEPARGGKRFADPEASR